MLPPAPASLPLSAHSGNEARSRVSSSSSSNGADGSYIHLKTCCARGECFSQRANSSDRNFSLLVRQGRREGGGGGDVISRGVWMHQQPCHMLLGRSVMWMEMHGCSTERRGSRLASRQAG